MRQTAVAQHYSLEVAAPIGPQLLRSLRERIIRTELVPGMRLSEQEIAETYMLSRQPVREAFIRLAEEGLVEIRPQRGTFVRKISEADVMDSRFVREAIEADIVRLVAETADPHVAAELRDLVARQVDVPDGDPARFLQLDETFHRTLADAAGKSRAWKILENIKAQMDRVRYLTASEFPKQLLIEQHLAIVDAVERGKADIAEAAMREHLRKVLSDLPTIIGAYPDFFEPGQQPVE